MDGHLHSPLVNNVAVISPFEVFAKTGQRLPESKFIKLTQYCQWQRWQVWHSSDSCWWLLPPRQNLFNQNSRRCLSVCVKRGQIKKKIYSTNSSLLCVPSAQGLDSVVLWMADQSPVEDMTVTSCLAAGQASHIPLDLHHPKAALAYICWALWAS